MRISSKTLIITVILVVALAIGVGAYFFTRSVSVPDRATLSSKPELLRNYDKALEYEKKIKENPEELSNYITAGSEWKFIGSFTREPVWYRLSLQSYERASEIVGHNNSLVLSNAATVAEELGDYQLAKKYYLTAIDLAPGDSSYHMSYINLLRYKLKASEFEVLRAFDDAMKRVLGGADLVAGRAAYLKAIGRYDDARDDLKLLLENKVITQVQYDSEIQEMAQLEKGTN